MKSKSMFFMPEEREFVIGWTPRSMPIGTVWKRLGASLMSSLEIHRFWIKEGRK